VKLARQLTRTPFATALAVLAMLSGIRGLVEPESLPMVAVIGVLGYIWAAVYFAGGALMAFGMATLRSKYEASGCVLFSGGVLVQAVITLFFLGATPYLTVWSVLSLVVFGIAGLIRTRHLVRGERLVWLGVK
jgi:hypothetical protein